MECQGNGWVSDDVRRHVSIERVWNVLEGTLYPFSSPGYASAVNCTSMPDGVYETGCKSFAECNGGQVTIVECPKDMVYNNKTELCDE